MLKMSSPDEGRLHDLWLKAFAHLSVVRPVQYKPVLVG